MAKDQLQGIDLFDVFDGFLDPSKEAEAELGDEIFIQSLQQRQAEDWDLVLYLTLFQIALAYVDEMNIGKGIASDLQTGSDALRLFRTGAPTLVSEKTIHEVEQAINISRFILMQIEKTDRRRIIREIITHMERSAKAQSKR